MTRDLAVSTFSITSPPFPRGLPHAGPCAKYMTCLVSVIWGLSLLLLHITEETPAAQTASHLPAAAGCRVEPGGDTLVEFVTPFCCHFPEALRDARLSRSAGLSDVRFPPRTASIMCLSSTLSRHSSIRQKADPAPGRHLINFGSWMHPLFKL